MRNVWVGLMFGAFAGAAIGCSLDLGDQAGRNAAKAAEAARQVLQDHGPELAAMVTSGIARGTEKFKDADVAGKARDLAHRAGPAVLETARDTGGKVAEQAHHAVEGLLAKVGN